VTRTPSPALSLQAARAELVAAATAVAALPMPTSTTPSPLAFADFGCSEGGNAVAQMKAAVDAALDSTAGAAAGPARRPVTVTHVDLTGNAWDTVFACAARGYGRAPPDLFVYAQGSDAGFYQQNFPPRSIALAHGAATFHWASTAPASLPEPCLFAWLCSEPATRAACARQAAADWATILEHRAAEVVPGGRFVSSLVAAPAGMDGGDDADPIASLPPMWRQVAAVWKGMVADGSLTPEEGGAVVIPVNLSTPDALLAPFGADSGHPAADAWRVVAATPITLPFPHWTAYERDGDAAAFGAGARLFLEAVLRGMMVDKLARVKERGGAAPADALASATAAVDTFFSRVEAAAAAEPVRSDQTILVLHLERKD
jgi:hypothetical protein